MMNLTLALKASTQKWHFMAEAVTWPYFPAGWGAKEDWKHLVNSTDACHLPTTVPSL